MGDIWIDNIIRLSPNPDSLQYLPIKRVPIIVLMIYYVFNDYMQQDICLF